MVVSLPKYRIYIYIPIKVWFWPTSSTEQHTPAPALPRATVKAGTPTRTPARMLLYNVPRLTLCPKELYAHTVPTHPHLRCPATQWEPARPLACSCTMCPGSLRAQRSCRHSAKAAAIRGGAPVMRVTRRYLVPGTISGYGQIQCVCMVHMCVFGTNVLCNSLRMFWWHQMIKWECVQTKGVCMRHWPIVSMSDEQRRKHALGLGCLSEWKWRGSG
jgi:hypothetical protein